MILLALIAITVIHSVHAARIRITEIDRQLLPPWCEYGFKRYQFQFYSSRDMDIKDPMIAAFMLKLDKTKCQMLHHYCRGRAWMNRFQMKYAEEQGAIKQQEEAISEFRFTMQHSSPECALVPDMLTRIGELRAADRDYKTAEKNYLAALKADPRYTPAFIGLSNLYEQIGASDKAVLILQKGIEANPKSSALKKKLQRITERVQGIQ